MLAYALSEAAQETCFVGRERTGRVGEVARRKTHRAIHIELELRVRTVADAHGPRIAEPTPMAEFLFPELGAAVHVVQHPQLRPGQARRVQHPVEECAGLVEVGATGGREAGERRGTAD